MDEEKERSGEVRPNGANPHRNRGFRSASFALSHGCFRFLPPDVALNAAKIGLPLVFRRDNRKLAQTLQELDTLDDETRKLVVGILQMAIRSHKAKQLLSAS